MILDIQGSQEVLSKKLATERFDVVVDWIAFTQSMLNEIWRYLKTGEPICFHQFGSTYQKPPLHYGSPKTPAENPTGSIRGIRSPVRAADAGLPEDGFPVTIIRPSLTYGPSMIPLCVNSWEHPFTIIERMRSEKKVIVPGDGTSLWTLTWNEDFATGFLGLLGKAETIGQAFHITSDEALTWNQIYLETYTALGLEPNLVHIPSDLLAAYDEQYAGSLIGE